MFSDRAVKNVREGVQRGEPVAGPFDVQVMPLTSCNLSCRFCPLHTGAEEDIRRYAPRFIEPPARMEWPTLERVVSGLAELGHVERVHFTGGEPLMHSRIADMVAAFKSTFDAVSVCVVTNGILLKDRVGQLVEAGLDRLNVSLNAADAGSFVELSPSNRSGDFDRIIEGLDAISEYTGKGPGRIELAMSSVLTRHNFACVEAMLEIATRVGASSLTYLPLVPFDYGGRKSNRELEVSAGDFAVFMENVKKLSINAQKSGLWLGYGGRENDGGVFQAPIEELNRPCYAGYSFLVFWPNGDVRPCCNCDAVMGNVFRQPVKKIWHSEWYAEFRKRNFYRDLSKNYKCECRECGYLYENSVLNEKVEI